MLHSHRLTAFLVLACAIVFAADKPSTTTQPAATPASTEKKSTSKSHPGRKPVVMKNHDGYSKFSWGDNADIKPDPVQAKAIFDLLRFTPVEVSPETVKVGETVTFTCKLAMENPDPMPVPPCIEQNGMMHQSLGGIQYYIEKVSGSSNIAQYDRDGTRARYETAYADSGRLLFVDHSITPCDKPIEFRDIVPGPELKLRRKVDKLPYAFLPPNASFTLTHSITTDGFAPGVYVSTVYYFDYSGRIIDLKQAWFTVR
jgi:hypothetical protein